MREELLALAEAAELMRAPRGDDRRDSLGFVADERGRGALLGRGVAPLEEGEERIVQGEPQLRAGALLAIGAHARRDRDEGSHEPREEIEREIARHHDEHQQVERKLDAIGRRDDDDIARRLAREKRDRDGDRREDDGPEREPHG